MKRIPSRLRYLANKGEGKWLTKVSSIIWKAQAGRNNRGNTWKYMTASEDFIRGVCEITAGSRWQTVRGEHLRGAREKGRALQWSRETPSREVTSQAVPKPFAPGRLRLSHTVSRDWMAEPCALWTRGGRCVPLPDHRGRLFYRGAQQHIALSPPLTLGPLLPHNTAFHHGSVEVMEQKTGFWRSPLEWKVFLLMLHSMQQGLTLHKATGPQDERWSWSQLHQHCDRQKGLGLPPILSNTHKACFCHSRVSHNQIRYLGHCQWQCRKNATISIPGIWLSICQNSWAAIKNEAQNKYFGVFFPTNLVMVLLRELLPQFEAMQSETASVKTLLELGKQ